jgi:outer membrane protein OmpA-like peptidoglycan-associated protein
MGGGHMIFSYRRRAFASLTALTLLAAVAAPLSVRAAEDDLPIDAVPLIRPGSPMRGLEPSDEPLASPEAAPAPQAEPAPETTPAEPAAPEATGARPTPPPSENSRPAGVLPAPEAALLRLQFAPDEAVLNAQEIAQLNDFAAGFKARGGRIGLNSYAGNPGDTGSNARRLSLKRVLAVREALIAQGIDPLRMEVHALGGVRDAGPPDRVDIVKSGR